VSTRRRVVYVTPGSTWWGACCGCAACGLVGCGVVRSLLCEAGGLVFDASAGWRLRYKRCGDGRRLAHAVGQCFALQCDRRPLALRRAASSRFNVRCPWLAPLCAAVLGLQSQRLERRCDGATVRRCDQRLALPCGAWATAWRCGGGSEPLGARCAEPALPDDVVQASCYAVPAHRLRCSPAINAWRSRAVRGHRLAASVKDQRPLGACGTGHRRLEPAVQAPAPHGARGVDCQRSRRSRV
jgi:hypothetical protein